MIAGQIVIQMMADLARLKTDMDEAKNVVGAAVQGMTNSVEFLKGVFKGFVGAISAGAFVHWIKGAIDAGEALKDLASQTGATVESLSALKEVGRFTGTSIETIAQAMNKLGKTLAVSNEESKGAGDAIKALGLDYETFRKQTSDQQLITLAKAFDNFADGSGKSAVAMTLLGREGAKLLPFLKDLAAQGELNATVTAEQAEQADRFNDMLSASQARTDALARSIATSVLPDLINFLDLTRELGEAISRYLKDGTSDASEQFDALGLALQTVGTVLETLIVLASDVAFVFKGIGREIGGISAQAVAFFSGNFREAGSIHRMMEEDANAARAALDKFQASVVGATAKVMQARDALKNHSITTAEAANETNRLRGRLNDVGKAQVDFKARTDEAKNAMKSLEKATQDYLSTLDKKLEISTLELIKGEKLSEAELALLDLRKRLEDGTIALSAAQIDAVKQVIKWTDENKKASEEVDKQVKLTEDLAKANAKLSQEEFKTTQELEKSVVELRKQNDEVGMSEAELARRAAQLDRNAAGDLELRAAIQGGNEELENQARLLRERAALTEKSGLVKEAQRVAEEWKHTADIIHNYLEDALMRAFESGHKFFSTLWNEIKNAFKTTIFKLSANLILGGLGSLVGGPLGQVISGSGGSTLGTAGNIASIANLLNFTGGAGFKGLSTLAGLFGAGTTAGAATGTLAIGNAVGAVGGDALGAFIAANNSWAGVATGAATAATQAAGAAETVAAGLSAVGGEGALLAGGQTAALGTSSLSGALAAIPAWGWAALAAAAVATLFSKTSTPHVGGYAMASAATGQVTDITAQQGGRQNAALQEVVASFASSASGLIKQTAATFGEEWKGAVRAVFESDSTDPSWGLFHVLDEFGQKIAGLDALGTLDKDPSKGFEQFVNQAADAMRHSLIALDLPHWADDILGQVKDGAGMQALQDVLKTIVEIEQGIVSFQDSMKPLGGWFTRIGSLSSDAVYALSTMAGGIGNLTGSVSKYVQNFYSESKRSEMQYASLAATLEKVGLAVPPTKDAFVQLVEAQDLNTEAGRQAFTVLMSVADAFIELKNAGEQAADTLNEAMIRNLRKFQSPEQQRATDFGQVARNLGKVGIDVEASTLMKMTKDQILAFVNAFISVGSNSLEAKVAVLDAAGALYDLLNVAKDGKPAFQGMSEELSNAIRTVLPKFQDAAEQTWQAYADVAENLRNSAGINVSIDQLIGLSKEDIYAFASAFVQLSNVSDTAKVAVVNAAGALADLGDAADAKLRSVTSGVDSVIADFITNKDQLANYWVTRIQSILSDAGIDSSVEGIMQSTRQDIVSLFNAVGVDGKQAVLDAIPAWNKLQEVINGTTNAINNYRKGQLAQDIEDARLNTMTSTDRISYLKGQETGLFAQIRSGDDPVAAAQKLQTIMLRRIKEEGDLRTAQHQKEKEALQNQISALEKMKDLAQELKQFTGELAFSDLSPFNAARQAGSAKELFTSTLTAAQGGDTFAMGNLTSNARSYLSEAAGAYGLNSPQYTAIFNEVMAALKNFQGKNVDPQIQALKDQLATLDSIDETSTDILNALLSIDAALGGRLSVETGASGGTDKTIGLPINQGDKGAASTSIKEGTTAVDTVRQVSDLTPLMPDYTDSFSDLSDGLIHILDSNNYTNEILMSSGPMFLSMSDHLGQIVMRVDLIAERLGALEGVKTNTNAIASIDQAGAQATVAKLDQILDQMKTSASEAKLESRRPATVS